MTKQATEQGLYLYAVTGTRNNGIRGLRGINGCSVYTISEGKVCALVSDLGNGRLRPERQHLAAHQQVLRSLMGKVPVLPMRFGTVADNAQAVRKILSRNQSPLLSQLRRVAGKVEMGVRITWDAPNIFEYFVDTHPELRRERDRLFGGHHEPSPEDKIELGRMFERLLNVDREEHAEKVEEVLSRCCDEIKRNKCRNEHEVMNLACLIDAEKRSNFEQAVFDAAALFDDNFAFDYNGPWPPHNFAEVDLKV